MALLVRGLACSFFVADVRFIDFFFMILMRRTIRRSMNEPTERPIQFGVNHSARICLPTLGAKVSLRFGEKVLASSVGTSESKGTESIGRKK